MKLLVFGASGLVGQSLVKLLRAKHDVTIAIRKTSTADFNSLATRIVDFEDFSNFSLSNYDGIYCCLGTTIKKAGSKKNFTRVDLDYVKECFNYSINVKAKFFCVISALGANSKSSIFYNRIKGEMEESLIGNQKVIIVRPSLLIGKRTEFRPLERLSSLLVSPFITILPKIIGKYSPIKASIVAQSMVELSLFVKTDIKIDYTIKQQRDDLH